MSRLRSRVNIEAIDQTADIILQSLFHLLERLLVSHWLIGYYYLILENTLGPTRVETGRVRQLNQRADYSP